MVKKFDIVEILSIIKPTIIDYNKKELEDKGFYMIGRGDSRWAIKGSSEAPLPPECVIKVPHVDFARSQAQVEASIWKMASSEQKEFLAPIIESGTNYVVMRKANRVGEAGRDEINERIEGMEEVGLNLRDVKNPENWGYIDGKLVLIDYGDGVK